MPKVSQIVPQLHELRYRRRSSRMFLRIKSLSSLQTSVRQFLLRRKMSKVKHFLEGERKNSGKNFFFRSCRDFFTSLRSPADPQECFPCHSECDGCSGPTASDCFECKHLKAYSSDRSTVSLVDTVNLIIN